MAIFGKKYTINDLLSYKITDNRKEIRERLKIAIIDDEGFSEKKKKGLESRGFVIHTFNNIERPNLLADYPIIISDINGVAKSLDEKEQGIALIRQIVKLYPHKGVGLYSGVPRQIPNLPAPVLVINKDDDSDSWEAKIDELIDQVSDPIEIWKRLSKQLIDSELPSKYLADIESDYVERILKKKSFDSFPNSINKFDANIRNIISGVVSNGIFFGLSKLLGL